MEVLQPTSVPAERSFSKARLARRYCQESQSDQRFEKQLLLKNYYSKSQPWKQYIEAKRIQPDKRDESDEASADEQMP